MGIYYETTTKQLHHSRAVLLDWLQEYRRQRTAAYWQLLDRQEQEHKQAEERQRQAEWEAMTEEQRAEHQRQIEAIQERIRQKLSGALPYKHKDRIAES